MIKVFKNLFLKLKLTQISSFVSYLVWWPFRNTVNTVRIVCVIVMMAEEGWYSQMGSLDGFNVTYGGVMGIQQFVLSAH